MDPFPQPIESVFQLMYFCQQLLENLLVMPIIQVAIIFSLLGELIKAIIGNWRHGGYSEAYYERD